MNTHTIEIACEHYGCDAVYKAALERIVHQDHSALRSVGLPDTDTSNEANRIMNVAVSLMPHMGTFETSSLWTKEIHPRTIEEAEDIWKLKADKGREALSKLIKG